MADASGDGRRSYTTPRLPSLSEHSASKTNKRRVSSLQYYAALVAEPKGFPSDMHSSRWVVVREKMADGSFKESLTKVSRSQTPASMRRSSFNTSTPASMRRDSPAVLFSQHDSFQPRSSSLSTSPHPVMRDMRSPSPSHPPSTQQTPRRLRPVYFPEEAQHSGVRHREKSVLGLVAAMDAEQGQHAVVRSGGTRSGGALPAV